MVNTFICIELMMSGTIRVAQRFESKVIQLCCVLQLLQTQWMGHCEHHNVWTTCRWACEDRQTKQDLIVCMRNDEQRSGLTGQRSRKMKEQQLEDDH